MGEKEKLNISCAVGRGETGNTWYWGIGWYKEPVQPTEAILMSGLGCHLGPCLAPWPFNSQSLCSWISLAHVASVGHSDVCALGYCLRPCQWGEELCCYCSDLSGLCYHVRPLPCLLQWFYCKQSVCCPRSLPTLILSTHVWSCFREASKTPCYFTCNCSHMFL